MEDEARPVPAAPGLPGGDDEDAHRADGSPPVAVVLATRDRPHLLEGALDALGRAAPQDELLVVDSAAGARRPSRLCARLGVRVLRVDEPGTSLARNAGFGRDERPLVAFTDDDCLPQPGWTAALAAAFADRRSGRDRPGAGRTGDVPAPVSVLDDPYGRPATFADPPGHGATAASAGPRSIAVGGFDERLGPGRRCGRRRTPTRSAGCWRPAGTATTSRRPSSCTGSGAAAGRRSAVVRLRPAARRRPVRGSARRGLARRAAAGRAGPARRLPDRRGGGLLPRGRCRQLAGPPAVTDSSSTAGSCRSGPGGLQRTARSLLTALSRSLDLEVVSPVADPLADVVLPAPRRPGRGSALGAGAAAAARPRSAGAVAGQHRTAAGRGDGARARPRAAGRAAVVRAVDAALRAAGPARPRAGPSWSSRSRSAVADELPRAGCAGSRWCATRSTRLFARRPRGGRRAGPGRARPLRLLMTGWADPRKDVATAVARPPAAAQDVPHDLVLVGGSRGVFAAGAAAGGPSRSPCCRTSTTTSSAR